MTSTLRNPLSARFLRSSQPIPPDPTRRMRQDNRRIVLVRHVPYHHPPVHSQTREEGAIGRVPRRARPSPLVLVDPPVVHVRFPYGRFGGGVDYGEGTVAALARDGEVVRSSDGGARIERHGDPFDVILPVDRAAVGRPRTRGDAQSSYRSGRTPFRLRRRPSGQRSAFCSAWDGASSSGTPARRYCRHPLWGRPWRGRGSNRTWTPPEAPNLDDPELLEPAFMPNLAPCASDDPTFDPTFDPPVTFDRTFDPASERGVNNTGGTLVPALAAAGFYFFRCHCCCGCGCVSIMYLRYCNYLPRSSFLLEGAKVRSAENRQSASQGISKSCT